MIDMKQYRFTFKQAYIQLPDGKLVEEEFSFTVGAVEHGWPRAVEYCVPECLQSLTLVKFEVLPV